MNLIQERDSDKPRHTAFVRKLLLWLLLLVVAPLGTLLAVEGVLRISGYGVSRAPFLHYTVHGESFYVQNPGYYAQFFNAPPFDAGFVVPAAKAEHVYRILVLGGSAAQGWPDTRFAFHGLLELQLQAAYPRVDFQIINAALAGLNLNAMRPLADSAQGLGIDMVLVYCGNNEFQGPFGLETHYRTGRIPDAGTIRTLIGLQDVRLVQWAQRHVPAFLKREGAHIADPRTLKPAIYRNFRDNLLAVAEAAQALGAIPVFCTVGTNLRDWAPLHSQNDRSLSPDARQAWQDHYDAGRAAQESGKFAEARKHYDAALVMDSGHAALHFHLAQCFLELGDHENARAQFEEASELDESTFVRCKPAQNAIIREVAGETGTALSDVAKAIGASTPSGIPGMDLFYDSCHPSFDGIHAIAMAVYDGIVPLLPKRVTRLAAEDATRITEEEARTFLGYDPQTAITHFETLLNTPASLPEGTDAPLRRALERLRTETGTGPAGRSEETLLRVQERCGVSPLVQVPLLQGQLGNLEFDAAGVTAQLLASTAPQSRDSYMLTAVGFRHAKQPGKALEQLAVARAIYGPDAAFLLEYALASLATGAKASAREAVEEGLRLDPNHAGLKHLQQQLDAQASDSAGR